MLGARTLKRSRDVYSDQKVTLRAKVMVRVTMTFRTALLLAMLCITWFRCQHDPLVDLQVTQMLPTKFRVNWPFCSGKESQTRFSILAILDFGSDDFSYFWSASCPDTSFQVSNQVAFRFRRRSAKYIFKWRSWRPSLISDRDTFS